MKELFLQIGNCCKTTKTNPTIITPATHFIIQRHCTAYPFRERFEVFEHIDKRGLTPLQMLIEEMPGKKITCLKCDPHICSDQ